MLNALKSENARIGVARNPHNPPQLSIGGDEEFGEPSRAGQQEKRRNNHRQHEVLEHVTGIQPLFGDVM